MLAAPLRIRGLAVGDVSLEGDPEDRVDHRDLAPAPAFAVDVEHAVLVVAELEARDLATAQAERDDQAGGDQVTGARAAADDLFAVGLAEHLAFRVGLAWPAKTRRWVADHQAVDDRPDEEVLRDAGDLRPGGRRAIAPAMVDPLLEPLTTDGGFEVAELEVGVVEAQHGQDRL